MVHHFDKLFVDIKGNRSFKEGKKVVLWIFVKSRMHIFFTDTQICKLNQCLMGFFNVYERRLKTIEVEKYLAEKRVFVLFVKCVLIKPSLLDFFPLFIFIFCRNNHLPF